MFFIQLAITSIIFLGILISNVLTVVLMALFISEDEPSNLQGADYYIVSLAISDLILGICLIPFSLISLSMSRWTFSSEVGEFCAYLWFSLWLLNIYTLLLLSKDRCLHITDKKYCQYNNRTRVRCLCEIILAWFMALSISFIPVTYNSARSSTILVEDHVCTINWHQSIGYFATIFITTVVPCLACSSFNFIKIFFWKMQWEFQKRKEKLSADSVQRLVDPTHVVCLVLFIIFWSSWIPFGINIYWSLSELQAPSFFCFWVGGSQGIWKFPIMIIICPRYREYFSNFIINKFTNVTTATNANVFSVEFSAQYPSQQSLHTVTEVPMVEFNTPPPSQQSLHTVTVTEVPNAEFSSPSPSEQSLHSVTEVSNVELSAQSSSRQTLHTLTEDIELHM